jgi:hypothetical protein
MPSRRLSRGASSIREGGLPPRGVASRWQVAVSQGVQLALRPSPEIALPEPNQVAVSTGVLPLPELHTREIPGSIPGAPMGSPAPMRNRAVACVMRVIADGLRTTVPPRCPRPSSAECGACSHLG